ncbi:MAG: DUF839 domain-containing protein [Bacteriovoracaceae bacterium]|jgi:hypothetical protein|nr:alkaline phosphatase [Halobacteriovoraceae bacterium]MDP7322069.1 DUF839 domain-containing protein [Bacteriovoracaceae bacterium]|tara:strand:+ start:1261 stop:2817 length:1557 start_codon:yes stop_codon:yes gene_type:complete
MQNDQSRRDFLKFLGYGSLTLTQLSLLQSCSTAITQDKKFPSKMDELVLANGLSYYPLISWGDKINHKEVFGFNNDYINIDYLNEKELIMWVNHEYVNPIFVSSPERTKKNVDIEKQLVGGSLIHLKKENNKWNLVANSSYNKGVRGTTKIPFANNKSIKGSKIVEGTLANCAGGKTPWNTFLTCEENYDTFYGERDLATNKINTKRSYLNWEKFYPKNLPEHYGWVVEIDPKTAKAKKHTSMGRFAHESATCVQSKKKKTVVYTGDDKNDEHLYKFVSHSDQNLDSGILYVANIKKGQWIPLDLERSPELKKYFKTQIDVLTYPRKAAKILGATALNRPEDIEIHPHTGDIFVALTNNKKRNDFHGSILKISERNKDYTSEYFQSETYIFGGELTGFSCPDNLAFDKAGNLWITTDISGSAMNKAPYKKFGNNGLFVIMASGQSAGKPIQVASAPNDAELTGLCFDKNYQTLFLSVQHPGELSQDKNYPTSNWPTGKTPKPSVVAITGKLLTSITDA